MYIDGEQRQWFNGQDAQTLATRLSSFFADTVESTKAAALKVRGSVYYIPPSIPSTVIAIGIV